MKSIIRVLALVLAAALTISFCSCGKKNEPDTEKRPDTPETRETVNDTPSSADITPPADEPAPTGTDGEAPDEATEELPYTIVPLDQAKVGDVVTFGTYEQDGDVANGKEPLEWLVLDGGNGSLLLITLYAIEHMQFHSSLEKVTWETSALRGWLNDGFLNAAFSSTEKGMIGTTTVVAEKNPDYPNSPAGNDTEDKVFLLSVQEAAQYFEDGNARMCSPTEAARASEPNVFSQSRKPWYSKYSFGCSWWLRSPGMFKDLYVSYVDKYGNISSGGQVYLNGTDFCVRPVLWVNAG